MPYDFVDGIYVEVPYGPPDPEYLALGKFQDELSERIYELTMESGESVGDVETTNHYVRLDFDAETLEHIRYQDFVDNGSVTDTATPFGAIVETYNSGAVYVSIIPTQEQMTEEWSEIEQRISDFYKCDVCLGEGNINGIKCEECKGEGVTNY